MKIFSKHFWVRLWRIICDFFNPKQRWLKIPRGWVDKPELIESVLFQALLDYVEGEECFKVINWKSCEAHKLAAEEIFELYCLIKIKIPYLENLSDYYLNIGYSKALFSETKQGGYHLEFPKETEYARLKRNELETQLTMLKTSICSRIVKIREYLWT